MHFAYFAYFTYFAHCPQVQLPHDRLLVLDGHHRPGPDVQEAGPTDSQGGRPEVENLKMCGLHAPASRDNAGAWCSHAKILQQASRLEKGTLYTQVGSWTFTKLYPPKSLFLNTSDPQILRCLQLYSTSFSEKAHNLIVEYQTFCV